MKHKIIALIPLNATNFSPESKKKLTCDIRDAFIKLKLAKRRALVEEVMEHQLSSSSTNEPLFPPSDFLQCISAVKTLYALQSKKGESRETVLYHTKRLNIVKLFESALRIPEGWSEQIFQELAGKLQVPLIKENFVKLSVLDGKVVWEYFDHETQTWYTPSKSTSSTNKKQILVKLEKDMLSDQPNSICLLWYFFTQFKNAGKHLKPPKQSRYNKIVLDWNRAQSFELVPWAVGTYGALDAKSKSIRFQLDHIPQHLFIAGERPRSNSRSLYRLNGYFMGKGHYGKFLEIYHKLNQFHEVEDYQPFFRNLKLLLNWIEQSGYYDTNLQMVQTPFKALNRILNFKKGEKTFFNELQRPITVAHAIRLSAYCQNLMEGSESRVLKKFWSELDKWHRQVTNKELTTLVIAVPIESDYSRTMGSSSITTARAKNTILDEFLKDFNHYLQLTKTTKDFRTGTIKEVREIVSTDIAGLGGFRYLYRQTLKQYGMLKGTPELDVLFVQLLRGWEYREPIFCDYIELHNCKQPTR